MYKFFLVIIVLLFPCTALSAPYRLTMEEQEWLTAHPKIRIGLTGDAPPISSVNKEGVLEGIDVELVRLLNEKLGERFEIVVGSWSENLAKIENREIDAITFITPSEERKAFLNFSDYYISVPHIIVAKQWGTHFANIEALKGFSVSVYRDSFLASFFRLHYPNIRVEEYPTVPQLLKAVLNNEVDAAVIDQLTAEYTIATQNLPSLDFHAASDMTTETNTLGVRKDWPELVGIINRVLQTLSHEEMGVLTNHWRHALQKSGRTPDIKLSAEEKNWIDDHPTIRIGAETDWPPYDFVANGKAVGFANDMVRLLAEKAGLKLEFVHGYSWPELLQKMRQKEIDVLPILAKNPERQEFINFTKSYFAKAQSLIVHKEDNAIHALNDMKGKTLAAVNGYAINTTIEQHYPQIKLRIVSSPVEALIAVREGLANGYLGDLAVVNYLADENLIGGLRVADANALNEALPDHIGVRKDWPTLVTILEKAIAMVTPGEYLQLKARWLTSGSLDAETFSLSPEEKDWLKTLEPIRIATPIAMHPVQFVDEHGEFRGISADYVKILEDNLGIVFEHVVAPWPELLQMAQNDQLDLLPLTNRTPARENYLEFTSPVLEAPIIIASSVGAPFYAHLPDLNGKTIAVADGHAIMEKLQRDYPGITLKTYPNAELATRALARQEVDAFVVNSILFNYYATKLNLNTVIHINNVTKYRHELSFSVRRKLAPLAGILNRIFAGISTSEKNIILDKWSNLPVIRKTDWGPVLYVTASSLFLLALISYWVWKMIAEIRKRKIAEQTLAKVANEKTLLLREVNHRVTNNLSALISMFNIEKNKLIKDNCPQRYIEPFTMLNMRLSNLSVVHKMLSNAQWHSLTLSTLCNEIIRQSLQGLTFEDFDLTVDNTDITVNTGNAHHLSIVLGELTINATKYALRFDERLSIKVSLTSKDNGTSLIFEDNGPGFPVAQRHDAQSRGIGLAMVKNIVKESMGGEIAFGNNGGAKISISFPDQY